MSKYSRRQLANYAVNELLAGQSPERVARHLAIGLAESGRRKEEDLLLKDIEYTLEERGILVQAKVSSTHTLSPAIHAELKSHLKKATGARQISLESRQDKSLLGGIKIETSIRSWDKSLKKVLEDVRGAV